jgi:hypothetical protein
MGASFSEGTSPRRRILILNPETAILAISLGRKQGIIFPCPLLRPMHPRECFEAQARASFDSITETDFGERYEHQISCRTLL